MHEAAWMANLDYLLKIWEWAELKLTRGKINNKLLLATDIDGMTALREAALRGN